jgi:DnaK suppressor protein
MGKFDGLKQQLERRRTELSERLERIKQDLSRAHSSDSEEQAQERENDEVLTQLSVDVEGELRGVNTALDRMKTHQYGVCASCSAEIPLARLEIKPEAVRCVKCA